MRLLVVDNEKVEIETVRRGLCCRGHEVTGTVSGIEALDILSSVAFNLDAVVIDYVMPEMDGVSLLKKIRNLYPALPVILATGYEDVDVIEEALREGCEGVIKKPFTPDQLIRELERVVEKSKSTERI
jgi:CheY-like chemotaxis protein